MPKYLTLGNGSILVGLDQNALVKDFYYHYPGLENHVSEGLIHKIGVWCEEQFTWLDDGSWKIEIDSERGTMASKIIASSANLGLELLFSDVVYNEKNVFIREVHVRNKFDRNRNIRIFFNQQFCRIKTGSGDTAYFDPGNHTLVHYKGRRVFLINAIIDVKNPIRNAKTNNSFSQYSTGILGLEGKEGTYKDAEDGELVNNPIEHGQVDSVLRIDLAIAPKSEGKLYYWICVAKSIIKAQQLNDYVINRGPDALVKSTKDYWKAWVHNQNFSFYGLSDKVIDLFNTSLVQIRSHVARNGAIIASSDSDLLKHGRDTYSYVWPRDAAFCALALDKAGDFNAAMRFYDFCNKVITPEGYFMHKYLPDYSLGSSWHPWIRNGKKQIPIQEDETALVIYALWSHYELSKDLEFIESIYNSLIKNAAEFMVNYRDKKTGLPKPSYDLWEEKYGVSTFTASSVYGALIVAANFAKLLGKEQSAQRYKRAADNVQKGILTYLFDKKNNVFYRQLEIKGNDMIPDETVDMSSVAGVYKFKVLECSDERLKKAFEVTLERLRVRTDLGGIARYEGDWYHRTGGDIPGNPWLITSLWHLQYLIDFVTKEEDLPDIVNKFSWFVDRSLPSGVMPEQFDPYTGVPLSATPLTWSHAEYVITVIKYLEKIEEIGICKACYSLNK
ncbi:glycoside hydrolase family 15 protein [Candidatus Woesebacteria bacterium]|nr:MAG: glycoside hydrolase family 15 protein [Candidatus Woesebacteria bacterium]